MGLNAGFALEVREMESGCKTSAGTGTEEPPAVEPQAATMSATTIGPTGFKILFMIAAFLLLETRTVREAFGVIAGVEAATEAVLVCKFRRAVLIDVDCASQFSRAEGISRGVQSTE